MKKITLLVLALIAFQFNYAQDTCATAVAVSAGTTTVGTLNGTTPDGSCYTGLATVGEWYSYTPTANYAVTISSNLTVNDGVTNSDDTRVSIFTGSCAALTCYAFADDTDTNYLSEVSFFAESGETYYILWDDFWSDFGFDFVLTESNCSATTAPEAVTNPTPADGADVILVGGGTAFAWDESLTGEPADSYTISIGTTAAANEIGTLADATSGNTITFAGVANTTYYWKIDAINCFGTTTSAVWSFNTIDCPETAAPACPTLITPADGELAAAISDDGSGTGSVNIAWDAIPGVSSYEITFDGVVLGTTSLTDLNITGLDLATDYTWSIAPINCFGTATGCATWSFTTGDDLLSVEQNALTTFSVYPNPTSNILNIESTQEIDNVTVFNLLGQNVASFSKNEITNSSIDMSELSKGLYLVKITSGDKTQTLRVTKE